MRDYPYCQADETPKLDFEANATGLDVEMSVDVKNTNPDYYNENANSLLRSAWTIANRNGENTNWEAFKKAVYKELVIEHANRPSKSDVSMTQDILMDIKTKERG